MAKKFDYNKRADECSLYAAVAKNDRAREVWAKMEKYWRKRAAAGADVPLVPTQPAKPDTSEQRDRAKPSAKPKPQRVR
jgi:hypothetical protein